MCGIFGLIASKGTITNEESIRQYLESLFLLSEPRGQEASGLVLVSNQEAIIYKKGLQPSKLLKSEGFKRYLESSLKPFKSTCKSKISSSLAAIGHCRLVTNGTEIITQNNQPILTGKTFGVHNGIITNDLELWEAHPEAERHLSTDTEILLKLIDQNCEKGQEIKTAVGHAFKEIKGSASLACFRNETAGLILATNFGSLFYCLLESQGLFFFASEHFFLQTFLHHHFAEIKAEDKQIVQVKAGSGRMVSFDNLEIINFGLYNIETVNEVKTSNPIDESYFKISDASNQITQITRCKICILPHTYPFIEFNNEGVCNFCQDYTPQNLKGQEALEIILDKHRRGNGQPDCLVGFSGGRDSSYALHLLKSKFGMEPIAFSYDWGMVTDISRRNQARILSKLKIEHILRAADIPSKRRFMRKNIHAWLKRPHLGMVPLFMAGDKLFLDILGNLKKALGIDLLILGAGNPLENCTFKAGFTGVRDSENWENFTKWSVWDKIRITKFYLKQYILNPSYLNESLLDTFLAYRASFLKKDNLLYLYNYLKWDEEEINQTLVDKYDWQTANHTKNFWRIGDGYTTFANYIYYTVAGFSEFDTFRSHQVRQGLITRQKALEHCEEDNRPDYQILKEFAQQVGINLEEVLLKIDSIKKIY
jgi:glutamine---fructose-6-phosphate transaminase (isomerizing)